jgi:hypothetical protein
MDLSQLAMREELHISDTTRPSVKILPEPQALDFAWARANPGEWDYFVDPGVDEESAGPRNLIGGRLAGDDGTFVRTWLNPDFVPTERYSGWQLTTEFEVVIWRLTFGFNNIGDYIHAFSRAEFIMLLPADDPVGERQWPLVREDTDMVLQLFTSAGKLPPDTNPWLRRMVSGRDVLEQVCPQDDVWILINRKAFPYFELSGVNLLRWWREWQAEYGTEASADPVGR